MKYLFDLGNILPQVWKTNVSFLCYALLPFINFYNIMYPFDSPCLNLWNSKVYL